jgi:Tat protein secretion system quality control protein TatD with DNase activity
MQKHHFKAYRALANAVDKPTNRIERSVCDDMYRILDTMT